MFIVITVRYADIAMGFFFFFGFFPSSVVRHGPGVVLVKRDGPDSAVTS